MQDWTTCIHIQMPGFEKMPVPQKKILYRNFLFGVMISISGHFFQKFRLFITVQICEHHITLYCARKEYCGIL